MKSYKQAGEGYTIKCSADEVFNNLVEMYTYNFKLAVDLSRDSEINDYNIGKADGAVEVLSALLLSMVGGGQMFDIWQSTLRWACSNLDSKSIQ